MTAEHVIPRAAGNDRRLWVHTLQSFAVGLPRGAQLQRGLTHSSLCGYCNNMAGTHYVPAFVRWTRQAVEYRSKLPAGSSVLLPFTLHALLVAKELAVMTLAMSEPLSIDLPHFLNLRRLVTQPRLNGRTPGFRFFVSFHCGPPVFEGVFGAIDTSGGPSPVVLCQVGLEPLGYVVTADDERSIAWANRLGLCDISYFFEQPYSVIRNDHLRLRFLHGEMPFRPMAQGSSECRCAPG